MEACESGEDCADNMQCTGGACVCQDNSLLQTDDSCGECMHCVSVRTIPCYSLTTAVVSACTVCLSGQFPATD